MFKKIKKGIVKLLFEEVKELTTNAITEISKEKHLEIVKSKIKKSRKNYALTSFIIILFYIILVFAKNNWSFESLFYLINSGINLGFLIISFFDLIAIIFTVCLVGELKNIKRITKITKDPFHNLTNESYEYIFTYIFAIFLMGLIMIGLYSNIIAAFIEVILLIFSLIYSYIYLRILYNKDNDEV